jgi:hypothetical protein
MTTVGLFTIWVAVALLAIIVLYFVFYASASPPVTPASR